MIKGYAVESLPYDCWEIAILDRENKIAFTFELVRHDMRGKDSERAPTSKVSHQGQWMEAMRGLSEAMAKMGLLKDDATVAELNATKYHLEDMRKLTFMDMKL